MDTPLLFQDATAQLARLQSGDLSSVDLLSTHRARVEASRKTLNAVVADDFDGALRRAEAADDALSRGESWGPLHGLPMTIKDSYEVVGLPTTSGSAKLRNHRPRELAAAVKALVDAGAIVFGKTNLPVFGGEWQSFNPVYGVSNNP